MEERWNKQVKGMPLRVKGMPLVVLRSPHRSVVGPLLEHVDRLQPESPDMLIAIVLPEFLPARWWKQLLHNHTA